MWRRLGLVLMAVGLAGCPAAETTESTGPSVPAALHGVDKPLAAEWAELCEAGGCLCGDNVCRPGRRAEGGSFGDDPGWKAFLARDADEVVPFLLTRLGSAEPTTMHVCPCGKAIEGELAVYVIQQFVGINWTDYEGECGEAFTRAEMNPCDSTQGALRKILADPELRDELECFFRQKLRAATPACTDHGCG